MAVALPGLQNSVDGDEELFKENNKTFDVTSVCDVRLAGWLACLLPMTDSRPFFLPKHLPEQ